LKSGKGLDAVHLHGAAKGKLLWGNAMGTQHLQWSAGCLLRVAFLELPVLVSPTLGIGDCVVALTLPERINREDGGIVVGTGKAYLHYFAVFLDQMACGFGLWDVLDIHPPEYRGNGNIANVDFCYLNHCGDFPLSEKGIVILFIMAIRHDIAPIAGMHEPVHFMYVGKAID